MQAYCILVQYAVAGFEYDNVNPEDLDMENQVEGNTEDSAIEAVGKQKADVNSCVTKRLFSCIFKLYPLSIYLPSRLSVIFAGQNKKILFSMLSMSFNYGRVAESE